MESITQVTTNPDQLSALVAAARRDPAQFAALYDLHVRPVYRYFCSQVRETVAAEDLTSQTFLAALEALPRYQHRGYFSAWLFAIARRKAQDYFRQRQPALLSETLAENPEILARVAQSDDLRRLAGLFRALEGDEQELLRLRFAADLSFAEIAALLGKNEAAVKKSLYRLLARLQSQLE